MIIKKKNSGFTLIELGVVFAVIGVIVIAFTTYANQRKQAKELDLTIERMDTIKAALAQHILIREDLPCPARLTAASGGAPGDAGYGEQYLNGVAPGNAHLTGAASNCTGAADLTIAADGVARIDGRDVGAPAGVQNYERIMIGGVPTKTLNIPPETAIDGWGNRILYAVSTYNTRGDPSGQFDESNGGISVIDSSGDHMTSPDGAANYVLLSHGPNGAGAYTREGVPRAGCAFSPGIDQENCDYNDAVFRTTAVYNLADGPNYFDDIVEFSDTVFGVAGDNCARQFKFYAPSHPAADAAGCLGNALTITRWDLEKFPCHFGNGGNMTPGTPSPNLFANPYANPVPADDPLTLPVEPPWDCATSNFSPDSLHSTDLNDPGHGVQLYQKQVSVFNDGFMRVRAIIPFRFYNNPGISSFWDHTVMGTLWVRSVPPLPALPGPWTRIGIGNIKNPMRQEIQTSGRSGVVTGSFQIFENEKYDIRVNLVSIKNNGVTVNSGWAGTIKMLDYHVEGTIEYIEQVQ